MFTPRRRREALSLASQLDGQVLALFAAGEQGGWYDPSDMSSMFQDTAGTIPVNAIGQRVARINDKSGRGNHLTQATTGSQPFLQSASGLRYLDFDGIDDFLVTASIDFTATNKMTLCAGLRKTSDTARGILAELSVSAATAGSFFMAAPQTSATADQAFGAGGSIGSIAVTATSLAAPLTTVMTGQSDIAAPQNILRINGAQVGSSVASQGTGNFSNNPMYVGRRAGTSLAFVGRLYGFIVRGAASSAGQVQSCESWCNSKAGAF